LSTVGGGTTVQVLRMMGLSNSVHWLAWFITSFAQMSITMAVLTAMLKYGNVLMYSNPLIVFTTLQVFAVATIAFSSVLYAHSSSVLSAADLESQT